MKNKFRFYVVYILGMMLIGGLALTSCDGDDDDDIIDDGKIDPSTIATNNLIHHWSFEDSPADEISGRGTATGNVTYVEGRRGLAYQGAEGAYITWDVDFADRLAQLNAFSLAMWMRAPRVAGGPPMIFQVTGTEFLGSLAFFQENAPEDNTVDSLELKAFFTKSDAQDKDNNPGWIGHDWRRANEAFVADLWFHIVTNYDPATSTAKVYVNGDYLFTTTGAYNDEVRYQGDPGDIGNPNEQPLLGDLNLALLDANNKGIIGAWANRRLGTAEDDWMKEYLGQLDELRFYDKALSDDEVADLYEAEVTQLNE
ncbi:MAG: LamG-like jellyroll fold domain-containing protein [Bacteroidales bacterium]